MSALRTHSVHDVVDLVLPGLLLAAGALHPEAPGLWYVCFGAAWAALLVFIVGGAAVAHTLALRAESRIQGPRTKPAPIAREAFETARAMFVGASFAAWPLTQWQLGHETGMVTDLASRGLDPLTMTLATIGGVIGMDAWLYWKHRLLHTRLFFGFHKGHHAFRDPTPFAGFAVGPVESVLTFWPILLLCIPAAVHWTPLYFGLVTGFVILNFYLHCGVTIAWVERLLPQALFNTSAFHNLHHAKANTHFGEAMTVWDHLCGTTDVPLRRSSGVVARRS
jgi:lathosterol oxidase